MAQDYDSERGNKIHDLVDEGVKRVKEVFPDIGGPEAFILAVVFDALGPMLASQYTPEQASVAKVGKNIGRRNAEVRRNPIAEVRSYNPKNDTDW